MQNSLDDLPSYPPVNRHYLHIVYCKGEDAEKDLALIKNPLRNAHPVDDSLEKTMI